MSTSTGLRRQPAPTSVRIAVLDPLPAFQHGILSILRDWDADLDMPNDLVAWIEQAPRHVLFLTLESNHDWQRLTDLQDTVPRAVIVAVLTDGSVPTYVRAISAGAVTAMPRDARPEEVRRIFEQVLHGESILPIEVVRALTTSAGEKREQEEALRPHEVSWLRQLAGGATVAQLAHRTGYSERAMFRLLRQLYVRMNVKNRTEALLRAQERGWL